jgi:predicted transcriptional regulator
MRIEVHFSDRFYGIFVRIAQAVESINKTLQSPPEDFTKEDQSVKDEIQKLKEAEDRIPHGT